MADYRALGRLGWAFGAVAAAVLLAAAVVASHADQRPSAGAAPFAAAGTPSSSGHDFANLFHPR
jgi:hypothetical protein